MNQKEIERLIRVETELSNLRLVVGDVKSDVKKMMANDLPHIKTSILKLKLSFKEEINKLDKKVGILWLKVSIVTAILVAFISYLMRRFLP